GSAGRGLVPAEAGHDRQVHGHGPRDELEPARRLHPALAEPGGLQPWRCADRSGPGYGGVSRRQKPRRVRRSEPAVIIFWIFTLFVGATAFSFAFIALPLGPPFSFLFAVLAVLLCCAVLTVA